jgi:hypothetical protein
MVERTVKINIDAPPPAPPRKNSGCYHTLENVKKAREAVDAILDGGRISDEHRREVVSIRLRNDNARRV